MITAVDRVRSRWVTIRQRYVRWEQRQVATKLAGWSTRRRLTLFVTLPVVGILCCGGTAGIPVLWSLRETIAAGRGAPTPDAAANEYLMRLSYGDGEGLLPLLDDDRQHDLESQWRDYRAAMRSTSPPPLRLDFSPLELGQTGSGRAQVSADVQAVWSDVGADGRTVGYSSSPRTWVIETREDDGWRVFQVSAPPWCGSGGYVPRCGARATAPPAVTPSPMPSTDLLQHPREMLKCGPRDPFREMHSCPTSTPLSERTGN
jgi:hypothetical protein